MSALAVAAVAAGVLVAVVAATVVARRVRRPPRALIANVSDHTVLDRSGAVRSVQAADLTLPAAELDAIWTPTHLERLARTYWRFLSRCTLELIRIAYTPRERFVVFLARPFVLLRFQAPEYEMNASRGIVRWRIESGVLVSARGRGGSGCLQIDVRRSPPDEAGQVIAHVEVAVANFYPSIASSIGTPFYKATQSRIHVLVTRGFLRSLARLDLSHSRVGRFARLEEVDFAQVPAPPPDDEPGASDEPARQGAPSER